MNNHNNKKIEEILSSLDGSQRAAIPDFFYTRLKAKMQKELEPFPMKSWVLRPAFAIAVLIAVLVINAVVIFRNGTTKTNEIATNNDDTFQSIAAEYRLNDNAAVYELNQDK